MPDRFSPSRTVYSLPSAVVVVSGARMPLALAAAGRARTHPGWMGCSARKMVPSAIARPSFSWAISSHRCPSPRVCSAIDHKLSAGFISRTVYVPGALSSLGAVATTPMLPPETAEALILTCAAAAVAGAARAVVVGRASRTAPMRVAAARWPTRPRICGAARPRSCAGISSSTAHANRAQPIHPAMARARRNTWPESSVENREPSAAMPGGPTIEVAHHKRIGRPARSPARRRRLSRPRAAAAAVWAPPRGGRGGFGVGFDMVGSFLIDALFGLGHAVQESGAAVPGDVH